MTTPTEITLHQQSKTLEIAFDDGARFLLPFEFLRVFSPSAEVRGHGPGQEILQVGKQAVNIVNAEPVGSYAVKLFFDDGHDTGIFTWEYLHELGRYRDAMWHDYLDKLEKAGESRDPQRYTGVNDE
ncbi:MAG: DUF971 domain-containing protein [Pseudomonadota bacterium]|jgi:DUF971 family protein